MAAEIGTATDIYDLVDKLHDFVSTNADLVTASQNWTVLRYHQHNVESWAMVGSGVIASTGGKNREPHHIMRSEMMSTYDDTGQTFHRMLISSADVPSGEGIEMELITAAEVRELILGSPDSVSNLSLMPKNFTVDHSDDGSAWTTAATFTNITDWQIDLSKSFAIPAAGSHSYWRVRCTSTQASTTQMAFCELRLMDASGNQVNHWGSELLLEGPGLGGTDSIYVGARTEESDVFDWYNLCLIGFTSYDATKGFLSQPGIMPKYQPMLPLWDQSMPYWFSASGRAIRIAAKVSTSYEMGYMGFFLPYATPAKYPYPLMIGGMLLQDISRQSSWRFSESSYTHNFYLIPGGETSSAVDDDSVLWWMGEDGVWRSATQRDSTSNPTIKDTVLPSSDDSHSGAGAAGFIPFLMMDDSSLKPQRGTFSGGYVPEPLVLVYYNGSNRRVYGEVDGVYAVSGFSNAAENTAVINAENHVVIQNGGRTGITEYALMRVD